MKANVEVSQLLSLDEKTYLNSHAIKNDWNGISLEFNSHYHYLAIMQVGLLSIYRIVVFSEQAWVEQWKEYEQPERIIFEYIPLAWRNDIKEVIVESEEE